MAVGADLGLVALMAGARPRIRPGIVIIRIPAREEPYVIVKDPVPEKYYKFEEWEHDLLQLLDGTRDLDEVAEAYNAGHPAAGLDAESILDYVEGLKKLDLIEKTEQERHLAMMEQMKAFRRKRFYDAERSTLFQVQIPLFDPNEIMGRVIPWIRWWWSPWFVLPWLLVFVAVLGFLFANWDLYWASFWSLVDVTRKTPGDWVFLLVMMFSTGIWHELGHGLTCRRYGGEVHKIGIMIFYLEPAFYCGVDDSYLFPNRSHRCYVAFGGSYFELMLCSVALLGWIWTPPEWWIHEVSLTIVLLSGLSLVLFNLNPLVRLDGYYVLMDWLDVPDLREDSFKYLGRLIRKHILRLSVAEQPISRRRRRIYLWYGILSMAYTSTLMVFLYFYVRGYLVEWFGPIGYLLMVGLVLVLFRRKVRDGFRFVKHFWLDKRDFLLSPRGGLGALAVAVALVLLLVVPKTATRIDAAFAVEPGRRAVVRAPADGMIREVRAAEGEAVEQDHVLAVMESRSLETLQARAVADLELSRREAALARRSGETAIAQEKQREEAEARARLELMNRKLARLSLVAPFHGIVSTPHLDELEGRFLHEGEIFCTIDQIGTVLLAVAASELDIEEVRPSSRVRVLATAYPDRTVSSNVISIAPVALPAGEGMTAAPDIVRRSNTVRVLIEVGNEGGLLRPGMTGRVQFLGRPRSVAGKFWRRLRRWSATVVW